MSQETHDRFIEDIPAYALGALSSQESLELSRHLSTCAECRSELVSYRAVSNGLLNASPPMTPPASVRKKLGKALDRSKPRAQRWRLTNLVQIVGGLVIIILATVNFHSARQIADLRQQQTDLNARIDKNHELLGMLTSNTEVYPVSGDGFSGNLLLNRENNQSYLFVWNLPPLPESLAYQIWLVRPNGERINAGTLLPEDNWPLTSAALTTSDRFEEFVGVEVTVEIGIGSESPSGEQVLQTSY